MRFAIFGLLLFPALASAQGVPAKEIQPVLDKAVAFLKTAQQDDGSFAPKIAGPGVTGIVVAGLIRNGVSTQDPMVAKGLKYLESQQKPDGGVYGKGLANYTTSIAVMAFKEANTKGQYNAIIKNASEFVQKMQNLDEDKPTHGGFSYSGKEKPDLSNSGFALDALVAAGLTKDDPALKRALRFVGNCQNVPNEEFNRQEWARKVSDDDKGGFVYNPSASGDKNPHVTAAGGLRSVGSMTYTGLKSFLYAGVSKEDVRVKAAMDWIRRHYTLSSNPGMGQDGLFYYYQTFGKAMDAWGDDAIADSTGKNHIWRAELFEALRSRQQPNGSWANKTDKFGESIPELATGFALISLSYCKAK